MTIDNFIVRPMNRSEVDLAITWAATEGWNPGSYDAESFYQTDENGFFVGELNGQPVGCISAVAYDQDFGFLGFYIVKPQFRGQGLGHCLLMTNRLLKHYFKPCLQKILMLQCFLMCRMQIYKRLT